jgi:hypothetical protein
MLLTGSGDVLCGMLPALFQAVTYHWPAVSLLTFQSLFTESLHGDQLLALPQFSGTLTAPCPLCCVLVFSSLFIVQFFFVSVFCRAGGQSAQWTMLVYPRGGWGSTA